MQLQRNRGHQTDEVTASRTAHSSSTARTCTLTLHISSTLTTANNRRLHGQCCAQSLRSIAPLHFALHRLNV